MLNTSVGIGATSHKLRLIAKQKPFRATAKN